MGSSDFRSEINERFEKHREEQRTTSGRSWFKRLDLVLDQWVYKDEEEFLDGLGVSVETRVALARALSAHNDRSGYHTIFLKELASLVSEIPDRPLNILDLGAGGGGLLEAIYRWASEKKIPVELAGVDISPEVVKSAQSYLTAAGISAGVFQGNACALNEIADESFDLVVSSYTVHHIRTPGQAASFLAEVYRIARSGWLIVDFDRRFYGPVVPWLWTFFFRIPKQLRSDGIKSARRAYTCGEINFILEELRTGKNISGMSSIPLRFFPFWMINGRKR